MCFHTIVTSMVTQLLICWIYGRLAYGTSIVPAGTLYCEVFGYALTI